MGQCMFNGCRERATHALKLVVPDVDTEKTASEAVLGLELCQTHITKARASVFFESGGEPFKGAIRLSARPGTAPDFDNAYTEGVPLGSSEHQAHAAVQNPKAN